jgi:hypothetical protein
MAILPKPQPNCTCGQRSCIICGAEQDQNPRR